MLKPTSSEYASFYGTYVNKVQSNDVLAELQNSMDELLELLNDIPDEKWTYQYAEGKWTIKELILHVIDTERVMSFRALWVARNSQASLPGFDQDDFVTYCNANNRSKASLIAEFTSVRKASQTLFANMNEEESKRIGTASGTPISVRALAYIIQGHHIHHVQVLKEKYLL